MIRHDCPQGSEEWLRLRIGIPTASQFHRLITPKTMKPSSQAKGYAEELATEWLLGQPLDTAASDWMDRGKSLEPEAVSSYEFQTDRTTETVGLCLSDDGRFGASPDRLVGEDGGLEVKCPSPKIHTAYLLDENRIMDDYRCQVQGGLLVTGRKWWDLVSYHPDLPAVIVRMERDEAFLSALSEALESFWTLYLKARERLETMGCKPHPVKSRDAWEEY